MSGRVSLPSTTKEPIIDPELLFLEQDAVNVAQIHAEDLYNHLSSYAHPGSPLSVCRPVPQGFKPDYCHLLGTFLRRLQDQLAALPYGELELRKIERIYRNSPLVAEHFFYLANRTHEMVEEYVFGQFKEQNQDKKIPDCLTLQRPPENPRLPFLPQSIGHLQSLTELHLTDNALSEFPTSFFSLRMLKILDASNNRFTFIPKEIGRLTLLQELYFSDNQLTSLPQAIENLTDLQHLQLSDNLLTSFTIAIEKLRRLKSLSLARNKLESIRLAFTPRLQYLYLNNNKLTKVPNVGELPQGCKISLEKNPLDDEENLRRKREHYYIDYYPPKPVMKKTRNEDPSK